MGPSGEGGEGEPTIKPFRAPLLKSDVVQTEFSVAVAWSTFMLLGQSTSMSFGGCSNSVKFSMFHFGRFGLVAVWVMFKVGFLMA